MEKMPEEEVTPPCRDFCCRPPKFRIEIKFIHTWADGAWIWTVYEGDTDVVLKSSESLTRWSGLWFAKRWCKRYAKGKIKPYDDGSRTIHYDA